MRSYAMTFFSLLFLTLACGSPAPSPVSKAPPVSEAPPAAPVARPPSKVFRYAGVALIAEDGAPLAPAKLVELFAPSNAFFRGRDGKPFSPSDKGFQKKLDGDISFELRGVQGHEPVQDVFATASKGAVTQVKLSFERESTSGDNTDPSAEFMSRMPPCAPLLAELTALWGPPTTDITQEEALQSTRSSWVSAEQSAALVCLDYPDRPKLGAHAGDLTFALVGSSVGR